jgi:hypothetical protein
MRRKDRGLKDPADLGYGDAGKKIRWQTRSAMANKSACQY